MGDQKRASYTFAGGAVWYHLRDADGPRPGSPRKGRSLLSLAGKRRTCRKLPAITLKSWTALIGPGVLMVGSNIGGGEWLFGPIVTARYGGSLMWIATISIACQVFYNLSIMRYTLYTGEPIFLGFFRTQPGPKFWAVFYLMLDLGGIFPYLASNAAVPLAAVILGHLPGAGDDSLVRTLSYVIFLSVLTPADLRRQDLQRHRTHDGDEARPRARLSHVRWPVHGQR